MLPPGLLALQGVPPSDQVHDILLTLCTAAGRLDEALELVKRLAREHSALQVASVGAGEQQQGGAACCCCVLLLAPLRLGLLFQPVLHAQNHEQQWLSRVGRPPPSLANTQPHPPAAQPQEHSLNSLVRALAAQHPDRALRMMSLMQTLGMRPSTRTHLTLVASCARDGMAAEAYRLYSALRGQGVPPDGPTGSALICALCRGNQARTLPACLAGWLAASWLAGRPGCCCEVPQPT